MLELGALVEEAKRSARRLLGEQNLQDVRIREITDEDGEAALEIEFIVTEFDPKSLGYHKRSELVRGLLDFLAANGDGRFPYTHFATTRELAEAAANDD